MNKPAAIISVGVGVAFFALQSAFPISVVLDIPMVHAIGSLFASEKSKARAAVSKHLIDPASAEFDGLRAEEVESARYVCGKINSKDRSGQYAGYRDFVYNVGIDYAHIDDNGTISRSHGAFKGCPIPDKDNKDKLVPQALEMAQKIAKSLPQKDLKDLVNSDILKTSPSSQSSNSSSSGLQMSPSSSSQAGQSNIGGGAKSQMPFASSTNEGDWRDDRPPSAWPHFPSTDALSEPPSRKRTNSEAISFASDVDDRWKAYKAGQTKTPPDKKEITDALRALLAIAPESPEFPRAWALFTRLRKADREVNAR